MLNKPWVKPFGYGFLGMLACLLCALVVWGGIVTFVRALHGEEAYQFIVKQVSQQQQGRGAKPPEAPKP